MAELIARIKAEGATTAEKQIDDFTKSAESAERAVVDMERSLGKTGTTFDKLKPSAAGVFNALKVGVGILTGIGTALGAAAVKAAQTEDQFADLAAQAGLSVDRFKELSFAFSTVGISQEGLADISRKVSAELGQFQATGGGGFKAALEAIAGQSDLTADKLAAMSGPDALQALKNAFDQANIPIKEQQFLFSQVIRDGSKLLPLFADQGAALSSATEKYRQFNDGLKLTQEQSNNLGQVADDFDLMQQTIGNAATFIAATFAPQIIEAIKEISQAAADGAKFISQFVDSFRDPKKIKDYEALVTKISEMVEKQTELEKTFSEGGSPVWLKKTQIEINTLTRQIAEANEQRLALLAQPAAADETAPAPVDRPNTAEAAAAEAARKAYEERKQAAQDFVEESYRLNLNAAQLAEADAADRRKRIIQDADAELITAQQKADALEAIDSNLSAKLLKIKQDREAAAAATEKAAADKRAAMQEQADAFLNEVRMTGKGEIARIDEMERQKLDKLRQYGNQELIQQEDFEDAKTRIIDQAAAERQAAEMARMQLALTAGGQFFGALAELQAEFGDKQSSAYKVAFALQKGFQLASATMSLYTAIAQAYASPASITAAQKFTEASAVGTAAAAVVQGIAGLDYNPSARAQGGQFSAGQRLLVGEKGPELVEFGAGGRIANASDTGKMMNGGTPSVTVINQTTGRIDQADVQMDEGRIVIIARETIVRDLQNPNSDVNKTLDRTRQAQRRVI